MASSCWSARRHAHAIWVGNSNGTNGRAGVQNSSLSKLLRWDWNLEKSIATGTHNSERRRHLAVKREAEEDLGQMTRTHSLPREREAHSLRDSAQVTAPGAVTSKIVSVSTSPNRQNRSKRTNRAGFVGIGSPHGSMPHFLGR